MSIIRDGYSGLLEGLPQNHRVNESYEDLFNEDVFRFINFDKRTHLADFSEEGGLVVADCQEN